ncbi:MAG: hypothetical protein QOH43_3732 [Solirubrobacteraceae bacterium]|nr:hypothetical protein [Solirubrobacteraceae bacterium]
MDGGLTRRTVVASGLLAVLIAAAFAILWDAIAEERASATRATRSQAVLTVANRLELLVLDLETGQRGFLITHEERFLEPWEAARSAFPAASAELLQITAGVSAQEQRARRITAGVASYVRDYSVPLVGAAQLRDASASSAASLDEGKRRVDAIRGGFAGFIAAERRLLVAREHRSNSDAQRAIAAAAVGLGGSVVLIVLFAGYLARAIVLPVRRAAVMAGRLAGGDLSTRMPETGVGEVGALERAFNRMGGSLEASRDELRLLAEEQAALRRVATLVARAVPASELFDAVAAEVGGLLGADATSLVRYEADGKTTSVAGGSGPGIRMPASWSCLPPTDTVAGLVLASGSPARLDSFEAVDGPVAAAAREQGIRCSVGAPIVVGGGLWGVIVSSWKQDREVSHDTEARMAEFTELVATAIANADGRDELAASRARVLTTADETRRRIQRDLHDGAQQRLVHTVITLQLARRALSDGDRPARALVEEALAHAQEANAELRELANGILPAALRRGGLRAGIETLISRVRLPVSVDVTAERLPPALEATAYFVVAEALTNTVKHAHAHRAQVRAVIESGALRVEVRDEGVGGARLQDSSGLLGLHDRAAALGGELRVDSPPGGGTVVAATLPIPRWSGQAAITGA